jgi:probable rRNA maturation factor
MATSRRRKNQLALTVQIAAAEEHIPVRAEFRRWIQAALERDATITLRVVDESEGRALNRRYRGKDRATNVLTFVYHAAGAQALAGDIVLCAPVVAREADGQRKPLAAHYAHLTIHGALHLQGYDHERDADAATMEAKETALLRKLEFPDPYRCSRKRDSTL